MRSSFLKRALTLAATGLLVACAATPDRVVLLPQADGTPSAILVQAKTGAEVLLSRPYASAAVAGRKIETGASSAAEVQVRYQPLMDALPPHPQSYLIYFSSGDELTPDSANRLQAILRDVAAFPMPELTVIGHTDTSGGNDLNDEISMKRAELIRARLIASGIDAMRIEAVGRGKRAPLVPTADNIVEPRNRRVEIRIK